MNIKEFENWLKPNIKNNVNIVNEYTKKGDTFIDVGSNTGLFTQMLLEDVGYDYFDNVILFEPVPYLVEECRKKFKDVPNIKVEELALSDENMIATIYASKHNLGYNKIYKDGMEIHPHDKYDIQCVKFDEWIKTSNLKKVDFIKIDAEGHDVNVIRGMFEWLHTIKVKPFIFFENGWYRDLEAELIYEMGIYFNYTPKFYDRDCLLIPNTK